MWHPKINPEAFTHAYSFFNSNLSKLHVWMFELKWLYESSIVTSWSRRLLSMSYLFAATHTHCLLWFLFLWFFITYPDYYFYVLFLWPWRLCFYGLCFFRLQSPELRRYREQVQRLESRVGGYPFLFYHFSNAWLICQLHGCAAWSISYPSRLFFSDWITSSISPI